MVEFLSNVLNTTIYIAGAGALILSIPTIIFLYLASKKKDGPEYHHHHIFLSVMALALFGGVFFNMI